MSKFKVSVKMAEAKKSEGENAFAQFMSEVGPGVGETDLGWVAASNDAAIEPEDLSVFTNKSSVNGHTLASNSTSKLEWSSFLMLETDAERLAAKA